MPRLSHQTYGKHAVRVSRVVRDGDRHRFIEASVDVELTGDFDAAYTDADNRNIVATDTCKNTVYALAHDDDFVSIEAFAMRLARHFVDQYPHVDGSRIRITQTPWTRIDDHDHAFAAAGPHRPTAECSLRRGAEPRLSSGVNDRVIAKTTASGFADFHRDEFRTLDDTDDRILATSMDARWDYGRPPEDANESRRRVMACLDTAFGDHYSHSVQETLYRMATAVLGGDENVVRIQLTMPNKHHLKVDLSPFGRENRNEVFMVTDEPRGYITATVER